MMSSIRVERNGDGFKVCLTDPEIEKGNRADKGGWKDPYVDYSFDSWDQTKTFLDKVVDKALPADEFSTAFAKAAKESMSA